MTSLRSALTITFGLATNVVGRVFAGAITVIVTLLSAIYFSLDGHKFIHRFLHVIPKPYRPEAGKLLRRLIRTWRAYFRGQLNLMIIIGIVTWVGNAAIGLPGALALAVIAGVLELVPNLGPFLAAVPAIVVALIQGSTYMGVNNLVFALIVIGLYILIQQLENTIVVPRILGEAVDLHPIVVLFGVVVGTSVAGILGALLAAPIIASAREILNYLYAKILGEDPYPPEKEAQEPVKLSWLEWGQQLLARGQQLLNRGHSQPQVSEEPQVETSQETSG
jgi:predicted PurR-regulated permease PerM